MKKIPVLLFASTFFLFSGFNLSAAEALDNDASIHAAVDTYIRAWKETDEGARIALLNQIWSEESEYADPAVSAKGVGELSAAIAAFQTSFPNVAQGITSKIDSFGSHFRFSWGIELKEGEPPFTGIDVCELGEDGKFLSVTGFFGPLPETVAESNKAMAADYLDALFNRFDLEAIGTLIASDAVYSQAIGLPYGGRFVGLEEWTKMFSDAQTYFGIRVVEAPVFLSVAAGDRIVAHFTVEFYAKNSDESLTMSIAEFFDFQDGKIVAIQPHYFDTKALVDFLDADAADA